MMADTKSVQGNSDGVTSSVATAAAVAATAKASDNCKQDSADSTANQSDIVESSQKLSNKTTPPSTPPSPSADESNNLSKFDTPPLSTPDASEEINKKVVDSNSETQKSEDKPADKQDKSEEKPEEQPEDKPEDKSEDKSDQPDRSGSKKSKPLTIDTTLNPGPSSMLDVNTPLSATPNKIVAPSNSNATSANNSSENLDSTISADQEYKDIALKLFNEEFVSIQPEEYTQFLAASDNESSRIREYYMDLFKWDSNLLKSTRTLCHKLYLKGESQEIDRILSSFTKSYIKQHPVNVFCTRNFEKIYIVLYSLILLNTALHNSEVNKKSKIGQTDYIRNTFTTFIQQNPKSSKKLSIKQRIIIERELSNYYEDLSKNELHLKKSDDFNNGNEFNLSSATKNSNKSKRMSVAETIRSTSSNTQSSQPSNTSSTAAAVNSISSNPPNQQLASNNNFANSSPQTINAPPSTQAANPDFSTPTESEFPTLTRQLSDTSIWSTDTNNNRRSSLGMKRMPSATSNVSQYTAVNTNNSTASGRTHRVGFTRALASDNKFYNNPNASRASSVNGTPYSLRNRHSLDQLRGMPSYQNTNYNNTPTQPNNTTNNGLNRRSSRASVISKESVGSINNDDTVSVLSFDTVHMNNFDIEGLDDRNKEPEPQQGLEDFNVEDYQDHYDLTLELQGSPYLKEGLLKLKILNNDQQDSNVSEVAPPPSSAASTASGAGNGARGFFSFFTNRLGSSNNNHKQDANATSAAAAAAANAATSTHTGTNTSSLLPNKFNESFVVVSKGELALYSFDPKVIKKHQQKIRKLKQKQIVQMLEEEEDEDGVMGDGNWLKNAANIGSYNLCSTYAQLEKINGNTTGNSFAKKSIYWSLTFPKVSKKQPKKFIFEAGTKEIALEFINTCNFWASKITAIPTLEESISSIEYGWTNLDALIHRKDNFKKAKYIQKWEPLARGVYLSNYIVANSSLDNEANHLGMMKQFVKTLKYYNNLKKLYNEFNHTKVKFLRNFKQFANTSNYKIIIANYENKIIEYKSELNKYKTYLIILGFGLQLRFDLEQQDREAAILDQLENDPTLKEEGKDINEEATKLFIAQYEQDSELTQLVKFEIRKLFTSMKDVSKVIPTFQSSRSINNLIELTKQQQHQYAYYPSYHPHQHPANNGSGEDDQNKGFSLVKSPKTFTLSNYNDNESPINQLLQTIDSNNHLHSGDKNDLMHSFSTNTIKEEEEPEESDDTKTANDYTISTKNNPSGETLQPSHVLK